MNVGKISVVVVPRERFSASQRSLESLLENTPAGIELTYVDGGSPEPVSRYLCEQAAAHNFQLIRSEDFLSPNQARNIGYASTSGAYVVFVDNDVVVSPGWLEALVSCAAETDAAIVGPLCLIGEPDDGVIHLAGADCKVVEHAGQKTLTEHHRLADRRLRELDHELVRVQVDAVEFHCMLVTREVLDQHGPLDEALLSTPEHIDLCLQVQRDGGHVYFEPSSVVTYLSNRDMAVFDLPYYRLRWSDEWNRSSLDRFADKWDLSDDEDRFFGNQRRWLERHRRDTGLPEPGYPPEGLAAFEAGRLAQTPVALYRQMRDSGYSEQDLYEVKDAYLLATKLFAGAYRACGRPFVCHLVGTASVLAACRAPASILVASILHAVYMAGDFWSAFREMQDGRRKYIRHAVGSGVEEFLWQYSEFKWWETSAVDRMQAQLSESELPITVIQLLILRLANDLDEIIHGERIYSAKTRPDYNLWRPVLVAAARMCELENLAKMFDCACERFPSETPPEALRTNRSGGYFERAQTETVVKKLRKRLHKLVARKRTGW